MDSFTLNLVRSARAEAFREAARIALSVSILPYNSAIATRRDIVNRLTAMSYSALRGEA